MEPDALQRAASTSRNANAKLQELLLVRCMQTPSLVREGVHDTSDDLVRRLPSDKGLHEAAGVYARASCQEIATRLLELPQELRDLVYTELLTDDDALGKSPVYDLMWSRYTLKRESSCSGPPCSCLDRLPHIVNPNYLGCDVVRQVLQRFTEIVHQFFSTFSTRSGDLEDFMTADVFHVGVSREEVFQNLDLVISCGSLVFGEAKMYESVKHLVEGKVASAANLLLDLPFRGPRSITLDFTHDHCGTPANLSYVMRTLRPAFHGMKASGFGMKLQYINYELDIDWSLDDDAWGWTSRQWKSAMKRLGSLNVMFDLDVDEPEDLPEYLPEDVVARQLPTWNIIVRDLYGVDVEE